MKPSDFDYELPPGQIASRPLAERDASRMLLLDRASGQWDDRRFLELPDLLRGDELVVVNNARVLPARMFGKRVGVRAQAPGKHGRAKREFLTSPIEVLLTRRLEADVWEALVRPGRKIGIGERVVFGENELEAEVIERGDFGLRQLRFHGANIEESLERLGHVPLPPYIARPDEPEDRLRYQTIFAKQSGAVAAPTAGLHFTKGILDRLAGRGVELCEITLHVGLGTFQPIHAEHLENHRMHREGYEISIEAAAKIRKARESGRAILAVGTTVVRALEDSAAKAAAEGRQLPKPGKGEASLFIYPGFRFRAVNQMLTNFHLPQSSLLVMVAAFTGRERILGACQHAIARGYRFYSYGDCMLIR